MNTPANYIGKIILGLLLLMPFALFLLITSLHGLGQRVCDTFNEGLESGKDY
jgi:hypothetical protein